MKQKLDEATEGSDESETSVEETVPTSPENVRRKKDDESLNDFFSRFETFMIPSNLAEVKEKKGERERKTRKMNPSENSDEGCTRFDHQVRTKASTLEKGLTYAKHKIKVDMWKHEMRGYESEAGIKKLEEKEKEVERVTDR